MLTVDFEITIRCLCTVGEVDKKTTSIVFKMLFYINIFRNHAIISLTLFNLEWY